MPHAWQGKQYGDFARVDRMSAVMMRTYWNFTLVVQRTNGGQLARRQLLALSAANSPGSLMIAGSSDAKREVSSYLPKCVTSPVPPMEG